MTRARAICFLIGQGGAIVAVWGLIALAVIAIGGAEAHPRSSSAAIAHENA